VLIMTCNLATDPKEFFRPEFINRIDEIIPFRPLEPADLGEIVRIQLAQLADRVAALGITLEVSPDAGQWLAARGYDPDFGARPLRRVLQREIGDRLALLMLEGDQLSFR
jgi:ATP-dependent Clp protease ATP-binding subunit ClpB